MRVDRVDHFRKHSGRLLFPHKMQHFSSKRTKTPLTADFFETIDPQIADDPPRILDGDLRRFTRHRHRETRRGRRISIPARGPGGP